MFNCRVCAGTPFGALFGYHEEPVDRSATRRNRKQRRKEITSRLSRADSEESEMGREAEL